MTRLIRRPIEQITNIIWQCQCGKGFGYIRRYYQPFGIIFPRQQCIKHGLTLRGINAGPPRKPLQPLNKDDRRELAEVIRTMTIAIADITGGTT